MTRNLPSFVVQVQPIAGTWRTTDGPNHFSDRWKAEARRAQLQRRSPQREFRIVQTIITTAARKGA